MSSVFFKVSKLLFYSIEHVFYSAIFFISKLVQKKEGYLTTYTTKIMIAQPLISKLDTKLLN